MGFLNKEIQSQHLSFTWRPRKTLWLKALENVKCSPTAVLFTFFKKYVFTSSKQENCQCYYSGVQRVAAEFHHRLTGCPTSLQRCTSPALHHYHLDLGLFLLFCLDEWSGQCVCADQSVCVCVCAVHCPIGAVRKAWASIRASEVVFLLPLEYCMMWKEQTIENNFIIISTGKCTFQSMFRSADDWYNWRLTEKISYVRRV